MVEKFLKKAAVVVFGIVIITTFSSMLFLKYFRESYATNPTKGNNILYFLICFAFTLLLFLLLNKIWKKSKVSEKKLHFYMLMISFLLFMWQIIMVYSIYFETGWDMTCVYYDAVHRAEDGTLLGAHGYFTMYPHNVMITFLLSLLFEIPAKLGIGRYYFFACVAGAFMINVAGFCVFRCIYLLTKSTKTAIISWCAYSLFFGISPWMCVPYTDVYALLWPILIFTLYLEKTEKRWTFILKWILIGFLTIFGFEIKPTAAIISIAIGIVLLLNLLNRTARRASTFSILIMMVGILLGLGFNAGARAYMGFIPDKNREFPLSHYLMLGMNDRTYGSFDGGDRQFTVDIPTWDEKVDKELQVAKERFCARGVAGNIDFFLYKNMVNFDNGTFSWAYEGEFFKSVPDKHDSFSLFLREIYYPEGKYYKIYATICQGIWVLLIFGCLCTVFMKQKEQLLVPMLTMVGLTIFLLLFESRGRYVILYIPVYVMMGCMGLRYCYRYLLYKIGKN